MLGWVPSKDATIIGKLPRGRCHRHRPRFTIVGMGARRRRQHQFGIAGFARNPYNTAYATGGSSGGTGGSVAAGYGVVGLGSDTWGSIRNPSSNNAVCGLRPTWALVSRAGMIGLYSAATCQGR